MDNIKDCYYWIDSAVIYTWILNTTKKYDAYADKRLQTIRSVIKDSDKLMLVQSKLNPADIGTENKQFWFNWPGSLGLTEKSWPNLHIGDNFTDSQRSSFADLHLKTMCALGTSVENAVVNDMNKIMNGMDVNKYGSLHKLLKVTGLCYEV